jgi:hypothetical protein
MCEKCFQKEYNKFNSYEEFEEFNILFNLKIAKTVKFIKTEKNSWTFHNVYKCNFCNEVWCLSDADNHWRGYLVKEKNVKNKIEKDKFKGIGCLLFIVLIIFILLKILT